MDDATLTFPRRVLTTLGLTVAVAACLVLVGYAFPMLLLILAATLIAVFLRGLAHRLSGRTPLSEGWALLVVLLGIGLLVAGVGWWLGPKVSTQTSQLADSLPGSVASLRQQLDSTSWGHRLLADLPDTDQLRKAFQQSGSNLLGRSLGVLSSTLGALANVYVVVFIALFFTAAPRPYRAGIVLLVPRSRRPRAEQVLSQLDRALFRWLVGKLFSMAVVGVLTALGLWALGIRMPVALGLLAALFSFVPNFGPILSMVPAVLVALTNRPEDALYVVLLYLAVQLVESNLITPLAQKKLLSIPPALILIAQVFMGIFSGGLGIVLATPLLAMVMVLVKMLYINDVLGDPEPEQEMTK